MKLLGKKPTIDHDPREFTRPPYMSPARRTISALVGVALLIFGFYMLAAGAGGGRVIHMATGLFAWFWAAMFIFTAAFPKSNI